MLSYIGFLMTFPMQCCRTESLCAASVKRDDDRAARSPHPMSASKVCPLHMRHWLSRLLHMTKMHKVHRRKQSSQHTQVENGNGTRPGGVCTERTCIVLDWCALDYAPHPDLWLSPLPLSLQIQSRCIFSAGRCILHWMQSSSCLSEQLFSTLCWSLSHISLAAWKVNSASQLDWITMTAGGIMATTWRTSMENMS